MLLLVLLLGNPPAAAEEKGFRNWVALRDQGVVRQTLDFSCGIAALATYLTFYLQSPVSEQALLERLAERGDEWALAEDWRARGVSYAVLLKLAEDHGLRGLGLALAPEQLFALTVPAIVRLEVNGVPHFSLLRGVNTRGQVQLADPSWGNIRLDREAFLSLWLADEDPRASGTVLLLAPFAESILQPQQAYFGISRSAALVRVDFPHQPLTMQ
ncbi:C39 family peptidase [Kineobactrum sediminis]|uniref:C39 family peptidase n=1 Tax=Kineobactrum sediminis TaxID=1905677 RepID=UPI001390568C|nr:cysteine peptidase family C39 domain-containing protein [Kineobactrum sediminis]